MKRALIISIVVVVAAGGCVIPPSGTRPIALDAQFDAKEGASFRLDGTRATVGVLSIADSRCPTDVRCITAGDAVVVVALGDDSARTDTLRLRGTPRAVAFASHRLQLVDVRPYPISTQRDRETVAVLRVVQ